MYTIGLHGAIRGGSQVDVRLLQQIAAVTGAGYFDAARRTSSPRRIARSAGLSAAASANGASPSFREYGPLLAIAALLLLAAEAGLRATAFRRYP